MGLFVSALTLWFVVAILTVNAAHLGVPARRLVIWCWDYPQDLRFVDAKEAEVAYFAGTALVKGERVFFRPRTKMLELNQGVVAYPVLRLETDGKAKADPEIYKQVAAVMNDLRKKRCSAHIQLDFDASFQERPFYRGLLAYLKSSLPPQVELQITALASWCAADEWLNKSLYNERVAMLFSMGRDGDRVLRELGKKRENSIGVSYAEPEVIEKLRRSRFLDKVDKVYVFNPRPWTEASWSHMKREVLDK